MQYLPLTDEIGEGAKCFLNGNDGGGAVDLIYIDVVRLKALEGIFTGFFDVNA